MHTLRVTHKPYSVFEIYHVKYTNLVQSYTWPHLQTLRVTLVHCAVKFHITMLSTQISYKYHIYAQCRL